MFATGEFDITQAGVKVANGHDAQAILIYNPDDAESVKAFGKDQGIADNHAYADPGLTIPPGGAQEFVLSSADDELWLATSASGGITVEFAWGS